VTPRHERNALGDTTYVRRPKVYVTLSLSEAPGIKNYSITGNIFIVFTMDKGNVSNFQCQLCIKTFTKRHGLNRHIESVHDKIKYLCEFCDKKFARSYLRDTHHRSGKCIGAMYTSAPGRNFTKSIFQDPAPTGNTIQPVPSTSQGESKTSKLSSATHIRSKLLQLAGFKPAKAPSFLAGLKAKSARDIEAWTPASEAWLHRKPFDPSLTGAINAANKLARASRKRKIIGEDATTTSPMGKVSRHPWNIPQRIRVSVTANPEVRDGPKGPPQSSLSPREDKAQTAGTSADWVPVSPNRCQPSTSASIEELARELEINILELDGNATGSRDSFDDTLDSLMIDQLTEDLALSSSGSEESMLSNRPATTPPAVEGVPEPEELDDTSSNNELEPLPYGPTPKNPGLAYPGRTNPATTFGLLREVLAKLDTFGKLCVKVDMPLEILKNFDRQIQETMAPYLLYHRV